jgi:hypothetical protein
MFVGNPFFFDVDEHMMLLHKPCVKNPSCPENLDCYWLFVAHFTVSLRANQSGYFVWPSKTLPF